MAEVCNKDMTGTRCGKGDAGDERGSCIGGRALPIRPGLRASPCRKQGMKKLPYMLSRCLSPPSTTAVAGTGCSPTVTWHRYHWKHYDTSYHTVWPAQQHVMSHHRTFYHTLIFIASILKQVKRLVQDLSTGRNAFSTRWELWTDVLLWSVTTLLNM